MPWTSIVTMTQSRAQHSLWCLQNASDMDVSIDPVLNAACPSALLDG